MYYTEERRYNNPNPAKPVLPENLDFLPVKRSIIIKKEKHNKEQYIDLLLDADPSKDMINSYLKDGDTKCIDMYYYSKDLKKIKKEM